MPKVEEIPPTTEQLAEKFKDENADRLGKFKPNLEKCKQDPNVSAGVNNIDIAKEAVHIWEEQIQKRLAKKPPKKVAILYAANVGQAEQYLAGYESGTVPSIGGSGQAPLFDKIGGLIKEKELGADVHIIPLPTSTDGGANGVKDQEIVDAKGKIIEKVAKDNFVSIETINKYLGNVAWHMAQGYEVIGLSRGNPPNEEFSIGGGASVNWGKKDPIRIAKYPDGTYVLQIRRPPDGKSKWNPADDSKKEQPTYLSQNDYMQEQMEILSNKAFKDWPQFLQDAAAAPGPPSPEAAAAAASPADPAISKPVAAAAVVAAPLYNLKDPAAANYKSPADNYKEASDKIKKLKEKAPPLTAEQMVAELNKIIIEHQLSDKRISFNPAIPEAAGWNMGCGSRWVDVSAGVGKSAGAVIYNPAYSLDGKTKDSAVENIRLDCCAEVFAAMKDAKITNIAIQEGPVGNDAFYAKIGAKQNTSAKIGGNIRLAVIGAPEVANPAADPDVSGYKERATAIGINPHEVQIHKDANGNIIVNVHFDGPARQAKGESDADYQQKLNFHNEARLSFLQVLLEGQKEGKMIVVMGDLNIPKNIVDKYLKDEGIADGLALYQHHGCESLDIVMDPRIKGTPVISPDVADPAAAIPTPPPQPAGGKIAGAPSPATYGRDNMLGKEKEIRTALQAAQPTWTLENNRTLLTVKDATGQQRFTIDPAEIKTDHNDLDTFKAMLECYKTANPGKMPAVIAFSDDAKVIWEQAVKEVYKTDAANIEVNVVPPLPPAAPKIPAAAAAAAVDPDPSHAAKI